MEKRDKITYIQARDISLERKIEFKIRQFEIVSDFAK